MSAYFDKLYIGRASTQLENFKWKGDNLCNFRCPICGDSKNNKLKARGYFYEKDGDYYFRCHNCNRGRTVGTFLKEVFPDLYREYLKDKLIDSKKEEAITQGPTRKYKQKPRAIKLHLGSKISELHEDHYVVRYVRNRMIPKGFWGDIYFTRDFKSLVDRAQPNNKYTLSNDDTRLVFPFYDVNRNLIAFQGRALKAAKVRYLTIKIDQDAPKIFGLDRIKNPKEVFVVEGPIDSLFVPNCIAMAGSSLTEIPFKPKDCTIIMDNEPRSEELVRQMKMYAARGYKVFIWPKTIKSKDINEAVVEGELETPKILSVIRDNRYGGLLARTKIIEWSKI